ncbi:hypothetical protein FPOAC1_007265 [Fusarium poae]|uniref:hypothetical protein n=1 Tax=Fusarium poae TaxID=36050 RepID=UPI001CE7D0AD|nr:hypothetical protein FPOAC1_007265 [Fusarium poae]KAG8673946.1 hypothetical protein FPOAC1_007265 [Fusarium poae]
MASYTDCPPTPRATYTDMLLGSSTPNDIWREIFSDPLTPEANYMDYPPTPQATYTDPLTCPPTPNATTREMILSDPLISETEQQGTPKPTKRNSILETPAEFQPTDGYDNCRYNDYRDIQSHGHLDDNGENRKYREEDDDDIVFVACRPCPSNDPDSPVVSPRTSKLAKRSFTSYESPQIATSSTPARRGSRSRDVMTVDSETILQRLELIMGRLTQAKACTWESILRELDVPESAEVHSTTAQEHSPPRRPSTAHENVLTNPRKRKRSAKSTEFDTMRFKKRKTRLVRTQEASFKPLIVSQPTWFNAKGQPQTWECVWNNKRKCWFNKTGPPGQMDWSGEEFFLMLSDTTVEVRPNLDWLPVSMQWREADEDEYGVFEGTDALGDWTYQVSYDEMFKMLREGITGHGVVTKW